MRTVLAALDSSPAARPVLQIARALGELTGADVEAVHVADDGAEIPEWLTLRTRVPLRILAGAVEPNLVRAVADDAVIAAAIGARGTAGGPRPVGHTAMHVLEHATKPIVVVPPDLVVDGPHAMRTLLVPLEGNIESSQPILEMLRPLVVADVELVVLHVFTKETVPRTLDRPARDLSMWGDEFAARFCPGAHRVELRVGTVGGEVVTMAGADAVDLVVLSWARDGSPGHAAVIRDVLGVCTVPVLLLPIDRLAGQERTTTTGHCA
jgi:nucleotide-binding universal stress UspA family protein